MIVIIITGSNIFDVLVGLPLPWIFFNLIFEPVKVYADALEISILLLLAMLAAVIVIVALNGWKMTKSLGYSMLVLYVIFVAQDLVRNL